MNYFELHIGDYAQATGHLSFVEDAAYLRLVRKYYADERPIPADLKAAQRLVSARTREEKEAVQTVLDEFFDLREDGWHQRRCDEEIARYQDKQAKAKRSAEARWNPQRPQSDGNANASPNAMRTHSEGNAHQTPDTKHQTPDTNSLIPLSPNGLSTAFPEKAGEGDLLGDPLKTGIPDCPQQKVLALWAQLMPELQQPVKWTEARATALRTRWREEAVQHHWTTEDDGLRVFAKLFRWCRLSPFLMGKSNPRTPGGSPFSLTLPWLTKAENWAKVQEGNFHPER